MGVAPSTRRTYKAGVAAFLSFCQQRRIAPLPASELTLRYFCTHLSSSLSAQTIKVYLAAIRLLHIENSLQDPTKDKPLLHYLCIGIKRSKCEAPGKRSPVTLDLLRTIKQELRQADFPDKDKRLYWAAFTLAFYGFLRASEYTAPSQHSYNPGYTSNTEISPSMHRRSS